MSTTISGTNGVTFPDSTSMQTGQQACKAWVNFNGVGTVAIRAAYNVYGITDNGTGNYTVNFTTAMPDANYALGGAGRRTDSASTGIMAVKGSGSLSTVKTTSFVNVIHSLSGASATVLADSDECNITIFR